MPRRPRMYLPEIPAHIVQRGNNRNACFFEQEDYQVYLEVLSKGCRRYAVHCHAYCLMTNHVHLLLTQTSEHYGISQAMQFIGRMYVGYINRKYRRTGTLWEGRHKSSLIQADRYLLTCYRYIEMNPVAAGMVAAPTDYPWSSHLANAWEEKDGFLSHHPTYLDLGASPSDRQRTYRTMFTDILPDYDVEEIKKCLEFNYPLGNDRFREEIEFVIGRSVGYAKRGRPSGGKEV